MAELHDRFRSLDRIVVPDLWADVEQRAFAAAPKPLSPVGVQFGLDLPGLTRSRPARLALVLAALILLLLALALATGSRVSFTSPLVFTTSAGEGGIYALDGAGADPRTIFDGSASEVHVSPDGRYVLFEGAGPGLTLARTDGSSSRTFPDGAWTASWAPDSHAVVMATSQGDQTTLVIADVEGGEPGQIAVPARVDPRLAWSPDNVHLVYTGFEPGDPLAECQTIASMLVVDIDSRTFREFALYPARLPVWSHDGRHLAAAVWPEGEDPGPCVAPRDEGLALVSVDTVTGKISTTVMRADDSFVDLAWSADDRSMVWLIAPVIGGVEVVRVPKEGGAVEPLARLTPNWPVSSFFDGGVVWSPDRSHLAWTELDDTATETYSLWVLDLADGQPRRIAQDVLGYVNTVVQPLWSPDGAWIAFYRESSRPTYQYGWPPIQRVGGEGSIWIVRPDGSDERLVVDDHFGVDVGRADW